MHILQRTRLVLAGGLACASTIGLSAPAFASDDDRDRLDLPWDLPSLGILGVDEVPAAPGSTRTRLHEPSAPAPPTRLRQDGLDPPRAALFVGLLGFPFLFVPVVR